MGLIGQIFGALFGGGRNVITETAEMFQPNAEKQAGRDSEYNQEALRQFAAEFMVERRGWFDRFVDGLNRLPRPAMVIGVLALFTSAMVDPLWFGERMAGLALIPEPLWWLLGVVVSFYFGARHHAKSQDFQKSIATTLARAPDVVRSVAEIRSLDAEPDGNAALDDWRAGR